MSTILVVESDPIFGAVLEDRLHVAGHEVELLFDKDRVVAATTEHQVDLLIIEVAQPSSGGLEVIHALREGGATRALPILVLSESAESADRVAALRAGVDDYLTKPCDLEELMLRAERLVGSRTALAPILQGDLANHPLWELVQYIQQAGKSGDLVLRGPAGSGRIHLHRGKVFAARWEGFSGREALLAVFGMKQGTFRFVSDTPDRESGPPGNSLEVHEVLMKAAWLEDELEKRRRHLPGTGVPLRTTGKPVPAADDSIPLSALPVEDVRTLVHAGSGIRVFDLIKKLPRAPQAVRLAVAWLIEQGVLAPPDEDELEEFPTTGEIASTLIVDMAVTEFLTAARSAGFGTSALPFLILVEPGIWPELLELLETVPGYRRNQSLRGFVEELKLRYGGSVSFPSELGKLSLHVQRLTGEVRANLEAIVTVCAGVLLWLDRAEDEEAIRSVIRRLEAVKGSAVGIVVANKEVLPAATRLVAGTRRWRISSHAPRSLLGVFRLLQPTDAS